MNSSEQLAEILDRLDTRPHVVPARVELSREDGEWFAQIIADPLYQPVVGRGKYIGWALGDLCTNKIDWRRVRR